jgi:hypothetical protein
MSIFVSIRKKFSRSVCRRLPDNKKCPVFVGNGFILNGLILRACPEGFTGNGDLVRYHKTSRTRAPVTNEKEYLC